MLIEIYFNVRKRNGISLNNKNSFKPKYIAIKKITNQVIIKFRKKLMFRMQ